MLLFLNSLIILVGKLFGGGIPPPPVSTAMLIHQGIVCRWRCGSLAMTYQLLLSMTLHCYYLWRITLKAGKSDCTDLWVIKPTNYATSCLSRGVDVDSQSYLLTNK